MQQISFVFMGKDKALSPLCTAVKGPAKSLPEGQLSLIVIVAELIVLPVVLLILLILAVLIVLVILLILVVVIVKLIVVLLIVLVVVHFSHPAFVLYCLRPCGILCKRMKMQWICQRNFWKK